ncbi:MAG: hypothetical protein ACRCW1_10790 [Anaerotignaceae bacterium]
MNKNRKSQGMNVGSASLVMVFAVMCLTIFSVLSLITANNELKIAKRFATSIENYYNADYEAVTMIEALKAELERNIDLPTVDVLVTKTYDCVIDDKQVLRVEVECYKDSIKIVSWKIIENGVFEFDESLEIWSGEDGLLN